MKVDQAVLRSASLSHGAKVVYHAIINRGTCVAARIALVVGVSERRVQIFMKELINAGVIKNGQEELQ